MPDVYVRPHGDRWSLCEAPDCDPISEFATRAEAESAGRAHVRESGGQVIVSETDPTGLDAVQEPGAGEPVEGATETGRGERVERLGNQQAGF